MRNNDATTYQYEEDPTPHDEDVREYLMRWIRWLMLETGADGFRLDAIKHVWPNFYRSDFAGDRIAFVKVIQDTYDEMHGNNDAVRDYLERHDAQDDADAEAIPSPESAPAAPKRAVKVVELHEVKELQRIVEELAAIDIDIDHYFLTQEESVAGEKLPTLYAFAVSTIVGAM